MSREIIYVYKGKVLSDEKITKIIEKRSANTTISKSETIDVESTLNRLGNSLLIDNIKKGNVLTYDQIKNADLTAILRVASLKDDNCSPLFPEVTKALSLHMELRCLPVKLDSYNSLTNEKKPIVLFEHQISSIYHIRKREKMSLDSSINLYGLRGSIVKLEMGLGKTLTAITASLIAPRPSYQTKCGENGFPTLVIASKTVIGMWKRDGFLKFFTSDVKVLYYHNAFIPEQAVKNMSRSEIVKYDFVVTSYDMVCSAAKENDIWKEVCEIGDEHTLMSGKIVSIMERKRCQADEPDTIGKHILFHTPWERVICDESQRFANPKTFTFKAIMSIYGKYKLCLTGTPIRNYDTDVWAQLRFCGYNGITKHQDWKKQGVVCMKLHGLNSAILSVDYKDTSITLPLKIYNDHTLVLEGMEKRVYDFVLGVTRDVYDMMLMSRANYANVLALFTRLRQICIAPYLITSESKREKLKGALLRNDELAKTHLKTLYTEGPLWEWVKDKNGTAGINSTKMVTVVDTLRKIPKGEKVLIFSMFTSCLDLLKYKLKKEYEEFGFEQVDGDTPSHERDTIIESFNSSHKIRALLMTYKVGSEGLNLTAANHVICLEPWWTYAVPLQAEARAWRPGQNKEVQVYNIHCKNTIEDRIVEICRDKKEMASVFLEGAEVSKKSVGLDKYTLGRILGVYH